MRRRTLRKDVNHVFGFGREMGPPGAGCRVGGGKHVLREEAGQAQRAQAQAASGEELTAGTQHLRGIKSIVAQEIVHRQPWVSATLTLVQTALHSGR